MGKIIFASILLDISAIWIDNLGFFDNGMSPDYERNFASQWWEYPDEYEDDLTDLNNLILAPCHAYLQQIPQSKWGTGTSEFYLGEVSRRCFLNFFYSSEFQVGYKVGHKIAVRPYNNPFSGKFENCWTLKPPISGIKKLVRPYKHPVSWVKKK